MSAISQIEIKKGEKFLLATRDFNVENATPGNTYMSLRAVCYMGSHRLAYGDIDNFRTFDEYEHWCGDIEYHEILDVEELNNSYIGRLNRHAYGSMLSFSEYAHNHEWLPIKDSSEALDSLRISFMLQM